MNTGVDVWGSPDRTLGHFLPKLGRHSGNSWMLLEKKGSTSNLSLSRGNTMTRQDCRQSPVHEYLNSGLSVADNLIRRSNSSAAMEGCHKTVHHSPSFRS